MPEARLSPALPTSPELCKTCGRGEKSPVSRKWQSVLETDGKHLWCERLQLPISTRDFLVRLRSSPPARRIQGRLLNVCGTYASRKMGVSIQFESHTRAICDDFAASSTKVAASA